MPYHRTLLCINRWIKAAALVPVSLFLTGALAGDDFRVGRLEPGASAWGAASELHAGTQTSELAKVQPKSIRLAREKDDLVVRLEGMNSDELGKTDIQIAGERYSKFERAVILHLSGEDCTDREFKISLSDAGSPTMPGQPVTRRPEKGTLEILLPLAEFGRGPLEFHAVVQTLFFARPGMVGREASVRYPETGNLLLHIDGVPAIETPAKITDVTIANEPGTLSVRWKNNLKCRGSVTLCNRDGQTAATRDYQQFSRDARVDFAGLAPGTYQVEIRTAALNGTSDKTSRADIEVRAPEAAARNDPWLRVQGKYIVDASGAPFRMVGMARCQYHDDHEKRIFGPLDLQLAHYKAMGINTIRLAINHNRDYDRNGDYYRMGWEEFIDRHVDPEVQAIINAGMYVILDSHHITGTIEEAYRRIPMWEALARRYRNEPLIAVYELWNESYLKPTGLSPESAPALRKWFKECIAAIRRYDRRHIIMVSDWNAGWGAATESMWTPDAFRIDEPYGQVVFSKHMAKDHCNPAFVANNLDRVANQWNIPLVIGEMELEPDLQTAADLQRLLDLLSADANQYGIWFWRPHQDKTIFADVWSPWALKYASPVPFRGKPSEVRELPANLPAEVFTDFPAPLKKQEIPGKMTGAAFPADSPGYTFSVLPLKNEMPPGKYRFELSCTALSENAPALGLYYLDGDRHVPLTVIRGVPGKTREIQFSCFIPESFSRLTVKKMGQTASTSTVLPRLAVIPLTRLAKP